MAALTLTLHAQQISLWPVQPVLVAADAGFRSLGQSRPATSTELDLLICRCLLDEQACLAAPVQESLGESGREALLQLARWTRQSLKLRLLPLVLLAEASVRHSGNPSEAKSDVRQAVVRLVRDGGEATALLAYWLQRAGGKSRLPNALKKGLSEALAVMTPAQLLSGPLAMSLKDLLCLVHARPCDTEQAKLYGRILAGECVALTAELAGLVAREQTEPEALVQEVAQARLQPLRWLMLEREAETPELKQALRLALADALVDLPHWRGRTAVLVDSGEAMLARPQALPALQLLDIAAMLAALAAMGNDCLLATFASEVSWCEACVFPVETALRLRQADTGWGQAAWKAVADLVQRSQAVERVLILSAGEPDDALLANWQRYLLQVNPEALLIWVNLAAPATGLERTLDTNRMLRIQGWSDRLPELISLL